MGRAEVLRVSGAGLTVAIGAAIAFGSVQLWNGAPASWTDVVASAATVRVVARAMLAVAVVLAGAGIGTGSGRPWGFATSACALAVFVLGGFWANYVLFGDLRPAHTATNIVVVAVVLALLWTARASVGRGA